MKITSLTVKNKRLKSNIFLAPMAGYTDHAFRSLCADFGYAMMFTELVSAKGLFYGGNNTKELLKKSENENTSAQLFGADAYYMRSACESEELKDYDFVDINMGCPVPKVYKNGEGSALLKDVKNAEKIIKECVKSKKIISVKIRTGLVNGDNVAKEYALMAESAGASFISIHGRVRENYYSGEPDFKAIEEAKRSVKMPVIANGGIFTVKDAEEMMDKTGADGIMLARGAIANPFLVCELIKKENPCTLKEFILRQLEVMQEDYGERRANLEFKKFISYYVKGGVGIKNERIKLMKCESLSETIGLINSIF